jgi:RNA polymerase sigma factor (sigma-70 family)
VTLTLEHPVCLPGGKTADIDEATTDGVADDFAECFRAHYPRVVRALEIAGTGHPAAEDLAQEAFARTLVHWRRVRHGTSPAGYVYRVAFRLARRRHSLPLEDTLPAEDAMVPGAAAGGRHAGSDVAEEATLRTGVATAIAAMPTARRACAVLCMAAGMSTKQAAKALGIKESTVRKQIERARVDLRGALYDDEPVAAKPVAQEKPVPPRM